MTGSTRKRCLRLAGYGCWIWVSSTVALAAPSPPAEPPPVVVKRGLTGEVHFQHSGARLQANPDQDLDAPILVRVESSTRVGRTDYVVRFLGAVAGTYDLTEWMVDQDGRPASGLTPLIVEVVSDLPAGQGTNLYEIADPPVSIRGGYRMLAWLLTGLWCLVPAVVVTRRWTRPRELDRPMLPEPAPTLADQLRPLAIRAREQTLTVAEQGRLELLLVFFWRERLGRPASAFQDVLPRLRTHPEAGPLLAAIEQWLHRPGGAGWEHLPLDRLLEPYRHEPAVSDSDLAVAAGQGGTT